MIHFFLDCLEIARIVLFGVGFEIKGCKQRVVIVNID